MVCKNLGTELRIVMKKYSGRAMGGVMMVFILVFIFLYVYLPTHVQRNSPTGWKTIYTHDENGQLIDHSVRSRYPDH
jgi:hypothetical protein